ncbi:MAG TPA: DUF5818 domain-containing protein [Candidatus Acidoferrum sp.]|nr:DUF5818 domain-containing protein [Candidatus Acidoferrum sp.]
MTKIRTLLLCAALLSALLWIGPAAGAGDTTFQGEIADSQCAMGVHSLTRSHKEMIDMGHAGNTPQDCTKYCVHSRGGRFVLLTKRDVYKLDDQNAAETYAGKKVRVSGTLDPKTNIIQVRTIEPFPAK